MTVKELKEKLANFPEDLPVVLRFEDDEGQFYCQVENAECHDLMLYSITKKCVVIGT